MWMQRGEKKKCYAIISYTQEPLITSVLRHDKRINLLKAMLLKCTEGVHLSLQVRQNAVID